MCFVFSSFVAFICCISTRPNIPVRFIVFIFYVVPFFVCCFLPLLRLLLSSSSLLRFSRPVSHQENGFKSFFSSPFNPCCYWYCRTVPVWCLTMTSASFLSVISVFPIFIISSDDCYNDDWQRGKEIREIDMSEARTPLTFGASFFFLLCPFISIGSPFWKLRYFSSPLPAQYNTG